MQSGITFGDINKYSFPSAISVYIMFNDVISRTPSQRLRCSDNHTILFELPSFVLYASCFSSFQRHCFSSRMASNTSLFTGSFSCL